MQPISRMKKLPMHNLTIQITQRPPKQLQIDAARNHIQSKAKALLIIGAVAGLFFLGLYSFDNPPTGRGARYAEARPVDWWMVACIAVTLLCGVLYTKLQFSIQLMQPINKESAKAIKKLGVAQQKIAWYINQVDKEGRPLIEAEAKTCQLYANGLTDYAEKL